MPQRLRPGDVPDSPYIKPYEYLGLHGRYGHWPALKKTARRTFVVVYGQHAVLERVLPIIETLREYGDVYAVDNPGFGGMSSAYSIGRYPDLGFYAGHLEHFISEYVPKDRKITLFGTSFGFQMITELLEINKPIRKRIEQVIGFVGFVHPDNFDAPGLFRVVMMNILPGTARYRLGAAAYNLIIRRPFIVAVYNITKPIQVQFKHLNGDAAKVYARQQALLWTVNDHRTHGATAWDFIHKNDLTGYRIDVPAIHIGVPKDHIFNSGRVAEQLKAMYKGIRLMELHLNNHSPLDLDTADKVRAILPAEFGKALGGSANKTAVTTIREVA